MSNEGINNGEYSKMAEESEVEDVVRVEEGDECHCTDAKD